MRHQAKPFAAVKQVPTHPIHHSEQLRLCFSHQSLLGALSVFLLVGCQKPAAAPPTPSTKTAVSKPTSQATTLQTANLQDLSPAPAAPAKDRKARCIQVVRKYTACMNASYRLAVAQQNKLPPQEAARSKLFLEQLSAALRNPAREKRLLQKCHHTPPKMAWLRCVLAAPCDQLNRCRKKHISRIK